MKVHAACFDHNDLKDFKFMKSVMRVAISSNFPSYFKNTFHKI